MANEITLRMQLIVVKDNLYYASQPNRFLDNLDAEILGGSGAVGPTPGAVIVPVEGYDVHFEGLSNPAWVRIMNLDPTNYVEWGIYEPAGPTFYPVGELLPGQQTIFRFSRNLREQYAGSGTGTTPEENYFRLKANGNSCTVLVEAFEA